MSTLAAVPPPPRSPTPRAKSLIYAYTGSQFGLLLGGIIFTLVGGSLSVVFCRDLPGELAITLNGKTTTGQVLRTELQTHVKVNSRHPTLITFTYDGREGSSSMMEPGALAAGSTVDVEYLPSRPQWARVRGGTYGTFPIFVSFVLLFPLVGLVLAGLAVRSNRREIRAYRDGQSTQGRVTSVGLDRSVKINGRHPMRVVWSFDVHGVPYNGVITNMDPEKLRDFRSGGEVTVLYLEDDPRVNTVWVD